MSGWGLNGYLNNSVFCGQIMMPLDYTIKGAETLCWSRCFVDFK